MKKKNIKGRGVTHSLLQNRKTKKAREKRMPFGMGNLECGTLFTVCLSLEKEHLLLVWLTEAGKFFSAWDWWDQS